MNFVSTIRMRACSVITCENLYYGNDIYCPKHRENNQAVTKKIHSDHSQQNSIRACSVITCENLYSGKDSYCPQHRTGVQRESKNYTPKPEQVTYQHSRLDESKYSCRICGKPNLGGHIAKNAQKGIGNAIIAGGLGITILTGGLTAFTFGLLPSMGGATISGSAEKYSLCPDCRSK